MSQIYKNIKNSASKDFKSYATQNDLPLSNVVDGSIAYVESVRTLYIFDTGAWYGIRLSNDPPVITSAPPERVLLQNGDTYTFELLGEDPDGLPVLWTYEVIEGDASGNNINLLGNQFSLTASNVGKAFVIRFSVTDGALTTSTQTRFVLDYHEGLQRTGNIGRNLQLNMSFSEGPDLETRHYLQFDYIGNRVLRRDSTQYVMRNGSTIPSFRNSGVGITTASLSQNMILLNSRVLIPNGVYFYERDPNNIASSIANPYTNTTISSLDFSLYDSQAIDRTNNIIYTLSRNTARNNELNIVSVSVGSSSITELANRSIATVGSNTVPQLIAQSGNRLAVVWNSTSGNTAWGVEILDAQTLDTLGSYLRDSQQITANCFAFCQNFLFLLDHTPYSAPKMLNLTDLNNITEVVNFVPNEVDLGQPRGQELVKNIDLASERILFSDETTLHLYDFDSNNGTFGPRVSSWVKDFGDSFRIENTQIEGSQFLMKVLATSDSYQFAVLQNSLDPPSANNINATEKVYAGDTFTFTINGTAFGTRTIDYTYLTNDRETVDETIDVDINTGEVTFSPVTVGDYSLDVVYNLEDSAGEITEYNQLITVSSRVGPGASINNYLSTESGWSHVQSGYEQFSQNEKGLYIRDGYAINLIENRTKILNINTGLTNGYWTTVADLPSCQIYYRNSSEIYKIAPQSVTRYSSITNLINDAGTQCWDSANHPLSIDMSNNLELGAWYESLDGSDYLWWVNHNSQLTKFDISDPNNWAYVSGSTTSSGNTAYTQGNPWSTDNDEWVCVNVDYNPTIDKQMLGFTNKALGDIRNWTPDAFEHQDTRHPKFAMSRDYFFYTINGGTLTGTTDDSDGWIVVYSMDSFKQNFTEVDRVRVPQSGGTTNIVDIRFEDGVLYVMVYDTAPKTYIQTYRWDYATEKLTAVSTDKRCETYGDGLMWIDQGGVWTSNDRGNGQIYLTRFRGA